MGSSCIKLSLTATAILVGSITKAQTTESVYISRDATASAGETIGNGNISITYILGEAVGELFQNNEVSKYVTAGFAQPDLEIKEILDQNLSRNIGSNLTLFPNPVRNGQVKLAFNDIPDGLYTIDIIDVLGRSVKTQMVDFKKEEFLYADLDVSSLTKGVYFLRVGSKEYKGQVKLIKL